MEPIRVLQVVTTMDRAGLETMLMNYYRHIDKTKVQFDFLKHRTENHAYDEEIKLLGGRIFSVPPFNPLNLNGYYGALNRFFDKHNEYRIVHSHLDCLSSVPLFFAKKHGVCTRIAHAHVSKMTFDLKYPIRAFFRSMIPSFATDLFACSDTAGKWMFGKCPFRVLPNAIECGSFGFNSETARQIRKEKGLDDKFVIAHVGRFDLVKNHTFLLDVFREVLKRQPNSVLLLAGVGSTMDEIKSQAVRYGMEESVRFLGSVSDIPALLQSADAFVFPSKYEGLGISLIEAQAAGLPCFASENCVPKDVNITGAVQYLPLECGAEVWAEHIVEASNHPQCRTGNIQILSERGYDISIEAKKLQEFYIQKHMEEA